MRDIENRSFLLLKYWATVSVLALSFWSSGVFLVRVLNAYDVWSSPTFTFLLFVSTVPLVAISVYGVKKMFSSSPHANSIVFDILAYVLVLHAVTLGFSPLLYGFEVGSPLSAAAWLLWFGGATLVIARYRKGS